MTEKENDPQTRSIIGAAMSVHRELGCGFLEAVYQAAMAIELTSQGIPNQREVELPLMYKGHKLRTHYRADFICYDRIIVELKAITKWTAVEEAQILNYLKASRQSVGLLLNFGTPSLAFRRFIQSKSA